MGIIIKPLDGETGGVQDSTVGNQIFFRNLFSGGFFRHFDKCLIMDSVTLKTMGTVAKQVIRTDL